MTASSLSTSRSTRAHQAMIWSRLRQANHLRSLLRELYPAALVAFGADLASPDALAVLRAVPSPEQGRRLSQARIENLLASWWPATQPDCGRCEDQDCARLGPAERMPRGGARLHNGGTIPHSAAMPRGSWHCPERAGQPISSASINEPAGARPRFDQQVAFREGSRADIDVRCWTNSRTMSTDDAGRPGYLRVQLGPATSRPMAIDPPDLVWAQTYRLSRRSSHWGIDPAANALQLGCLVQHAHDSRHGLGSLRSIRVALLLVAVVLVHVPILAVVDEI